MGFYCLLYICKDISMCRPRYTCQRVLFCVLGMRALGAWDARVGETRVEGMRACNGMHASAGSSLGVDDTRVRRAYFGVYAWPRMNA